MIPKAQLKKADEALPLNLFGNPKMIQQKHITKLVEVMDKRYEKFLDYGALEGKTLVFYFKHNGIASEFNMNIKKFREDIKNIWLKNNMKEHLYFENIQARATLKPIERKEEKEPYVDRAFGTFSIDVKDASIAEALKRVRTTIQESHQKNEGGNSE